MAIPGLSQAYVGPGVGLSAIGSVLTFIGAIFLLIAGFLWYPIKRLISQKSAKNIEGGENPATEDAADSSSEENSHP